MRDPKNEAGKKELCHPGKRDGNVLKEEVKRSGAEDTTSMRGIDAAGTSVDTLKRALTTRCADTTNITRGDPRASNQ